MSSPNSFSGSFRADLLVIASIYKTFREKGILVRSVSDLVRLVLELYQQALLQNGSLSPVEDYQEAFEVLSDLRVSINNIQKQNLLRQMQASALTSDGFNLDYLTRKSKNPAPTAVVSTPKLSTSNASNPVSDEEALEIMAKVRRRDEELAQQKKALSQFVAADAQETK